MFESLWLLLWSLCGGGCMLFIGGVVAVLVICGIYKCMTCSMRDCGCIKSLLRTTGVDNFSDFNMTVIVHQAFFTYAKRKHLMTQIRIRAGTQVVETDPNKDGLFQQPLELLVEQGTENIEVDLISVEHSQTFAKLSWCPITDILNHEHLPETLYALKASTKDIMNPRLQMSIFASTDGADLEQALLPNLPVSVETNMMLSQQIRKVVAADKREHGGKESELSELDLLVKGTAGPLERFEGWGAAHHIWLAAQGPPEKRRYKVGVWDDPDQHAKGLHPKEEVDLLKVLSVSPDPSRPDVFTLCYVDDQKIKQRMNLRRLDRNRDVWVEMLRALIEIVRREKDHKKKARHLT